MYARMLKEVMCVLEISTLDVSTMTDEEFLKMYRTCDKSRKLKIDRLKNEPAKKLSAAAGMLARKAISEKLGIAPENISFRRDKNGKPYVHELDIHFSLSHSGSLAVCAISDKPVGIDVEKVHQADLRVAERMFTPREQYYMLSDKRKIQTRFFELWTKKEAYIKRNGLTLSDMPSFDVMGDQSLSVVQSKKYFISVAN